MRVVFFDFMFGVALFGLFFGSHFLRLLIGFGLNFSSIVGIKTPYQPFDNTTVVVCPAPGRRTRIMQRSLSQLLCKIRSLLLGKVYLLPIFSQTFFEYSVEIEPSSDHL